MFGNSTRSVNRFTQDGLPES